MRYRVKDYGMWAEWRAWVINKLSDDVNCTNADELYDEMCEVFPSNETFEIEELKGNNLLSHLNLPNSCIITNGQYNWYCNMEFLEGVAESTKNAVKNILETP